jgi:hypothetical protein
MISMLRRLGLRWMLPIVLVPVSAGLFWYGMVEDQGARAVWERAGWSFGAAWHPNQFVQTAMSINFPAMLVGVLFMNLLPDPILYAVVFGVFAPTLWWFVSAAADNELALGRAIGQTRPRLRERPITLSCGMTVLAMAAVGPVAHTYSPRLLGMFWIVWIPTYILSAAGKWRRRWLPVIDRHA